MRSLLRGADAVRAVACCRSRLRAVLARGTSSSARSHARRSRDSDCRARMGCEASTCGHTIRTSRASAGPVAPRLRAAPRFRSLFAAAACSPLRTPTRVPPLWGVLLNCPATSVAGTPLHPLKCAAPRPSTSRVRRLPARGTAVTHEYFALIGSAGRCRRPAPDSTSPRADARQHKGGCGAATMPVPTRADCARGQ